MSPRFRARWLVAALVMATPIATQAVVAARPLASSALTSTRFNISGLRTGAGYDRFIVRYRNGQAPSSGPAVARDVSAALSRMGLRSSTSASASAPSVHYMRKLATGAHLLKVSRKLDKSEAEALMRQIAANPAVVHVAPDYMRHAVRDVRASDVTAPNDPYYAQYQWHLRAPDGHAEPEGNSTVSDFGGADVAQAWALADGSGVTVAVLDTGITDHPDLDTSLADDGYDFITDHEISGRDTDGRVPGGWDTGDWTNEEPWQSDCTDANNPPESSSWHGTHVSGTVAELTGNDTGMAGVAGKAKILPVRVLGHCGGYDSDISDAIVWAAGGHVDGVPDNQHPAQVINLSLGGQGACSAEDPEGAAIAEANQLGATVVVAAGNSDDDASQYTPASCPGAVTVASVGITSKRAFYSNYGARVDIAAPGGGIYANDASSGTQVATGFVWSAINDGETVPTTPDYGGYAGTSQATPHVTGTVALMQSARLAAGMALLTPDEVRSDLVATAHAPNQTPDAAFPIGAGIVDAYAAVQEALGNDEGGGGNDTPVVLSNGQAVTGVGGSAGDAVMYQVSVPQGARALVIRTFGGSGDVSLYVKHGDTPSVDSYDGMSARTGNNESVLFARPAAGTYYIEVWGVNNFSNLSVQASFISPAQ